jgi:hypothetical protein
VQLHQHIHRFNTLNDELHDDPGAFPTSVREIRMIVPMHSICAQGRSQVGARGGALAPLEFRKYVQYYQARIDGMSAVNPRLVIVCKRKKGGSENFADQLKFLESLRVVRP